MEIIDKIVSSQYPPNDRNVIWENNGKLFKIINGKWKEISSGGGGSTISASVEQTDNGATIKITDNEGTTTATVDNGKTPIKGTDYWTESDKQEVIAEATAEIVNPIVYKGTLGVGGTITSLPPASEANHGYQYKVITAGTYNGISANVGDSFVSNGSAWKHIPDSEADLVMPQGFEVNGSVVSYAEGYSLVNKQLRDNVFVSTDCMTESSTEKLNGTYWQINQSDHHWSSSSTLDTYIIPVKLGDIIISNTNAISNVVGCILMQTSRSGEAKIISSTQVNNGYVITDEDIALGVHYIVVPHRKAGAAAQNDIYIIKQRSKISNIEKRIDTNDARINDIINSINDSEITDLTYLIPKDNSVISTPDIGQPISSATYKYYGGVIINVNIGEKYIITGKGGATYRLWAKVKDGIVVERAGDQVTEDNREIVADDTFNTIVVNFDFNKSYKLEVSKLVSKLDGIQGELNVLENGFMDINNTINPNISQDITDQFIESKAYRTVVGSAPSLEDETRYGIRGKIFDVAKGDVFRVVSQGANSYRLWAKVKNGIIISMENYSSTVIDKVIACDETFDQLVINNYGGTIYKQTRYSRIEKLEEEIGTEKKTLKILMFGNSFTQDSVGYVPYILKEIAPELDFKIGIAFYGGCSLMQHLASITGQSVIMGDTTYEPQTYWYHRSNGGSWKTTYNVSPESIIADDDWDIITFQANGNFAYRNWDEYFSPYIYKLHNEIRKRVAKPIKFGWLLTHGSYAGTNLDTLLQHWEGTKDNAIKIESLTANEIIFPYGTAVQNARKIYSASWGGQPNLLANDNVHLCEGFPCLVAAYSHVIKLLELAGIKNKSIIAELTNPTKDWVSSHAIGPNYFNDDVVDVTESNRLIAQACAICAVKKPYEVTDLSELVSNL